MAALAIMSVQVALTYGLSREEYLPSPPPLETFPRAVGGWERSYDVAIDPAEMEMLGPDDVLNRNYVASQPGSVLNLFVAYYKTQHRARNAHDPKVCLPGSGWEPQESRVIRAAGTSGAASDAFPVNYYVIRKGDERAVVLYWFQTYDAILTQTEGLRFRRVLDTLFEQRSDMALVRIVTPVEGDNLAEASERALRFAGIARDRATPYFPPISN